MPLKCKQFKNNLGTNKTTAVTFNNINKIYQTKTITLTYHRLKKLLNKNIRRPTMKIIIKFHY